jgi:hypothetical protein
VANFKYHSYDENLEATIASIKQGGKILVMAPSVCFNRGWQRAISAGTGLDMDGRILQYRGKGHIRPDVMKTVQDKRVVFSVPLSDNNVDFMRAQGFEILGINCSTKYINSISNKSLKSLAQSDRSAIYSMSNKGQVSRLIPALGERFVTMLKTAHESEAEEVTTSEALKVDDIEGLFTDTANVLDDIDKISDEMLASSDSPKGKAEADELVTDDSLTKSSTQVTTE